MISTQVDRIAEAISKGREPLRKPEPQTLSDWADENFYLSPESSYIEGQWKTVPFQRAPMNAISNDDIREITFMKSARVGYTKMIVAAMGYFATHKKRNQVVFQPVDGDAEDFVKDEVDTMLRDVPIVRASFPWHDVKHKNNTLQKKVLIGSTINIRGGKSAKNYRRLSVDVVYYDELDGFDPDVDKEGSPTTLGDKRAEGSVFRKSIRGSTPKIKGESLIEESAEEADYFFRFHVHCPHCDGEQYLKFGGKDADHGLKWVNDDPRTAKYLCECCGALFGNERLPEISEHGRYIDLESGVWTRDGVAFFDADDSLIETPQKVAFHIWTIYSPFTTWTQIVDDWLKSKGKPNKLKTFINTTLGETWEEEGESIEHNTLYIRREHYPAEVPAGACVLTAAVDVQDDRLEIGVEAWGDGEENWKVDFHILRGDPAHPELWDRLDDVLTKRYEHESGVELPIACATVDSGGHFTQQVYKFCKAREVRRVYAIKGRSQAGSPVINRPSDKKNNKGKVTLFTIGTDTAKEVIYARLKIVVPGASYVHFPVSPLFDEEYFEQLTAEQCVTRYVKGHAVREWKKMRARNEALDVAVYNLAALYILNPNFKKLAERLAPDDEPDDTPEPTAIQKATTKHQTKARRRTARRSGFTNSWRN